MRKIHLFHLGHFYFKVLSMGTTPPPNRLIPLISLEMHSNRIRKLPSSVGVDGTLGAHCMAVGLAAAVAAVVVALLLQDAQPLDAAHRAASATISVSGRAETGATNLRSLGLVGANGRLAALLLPRVGIGTGWPRAAPLAANLWV